MSTDIEKVRELREAHAAVDRTDKAASARDATLGDQVDYDKAADRYGQLCVDYMPAILAELKRRGEERESAQNQLDRISEMFPDSAPHKHEETGVSLVDDVGDRFAAAQEIASEVVEQDIIGLRVTARAYLAKYPKEGRDGK